MTRPTCGLNGPFRAKSILNMLHSALITTIYTFLTALLVGTWPQVVFASGEKDQPKLQVPQVKACIQLTYEGVAALEADDWAQLDRIAKDYIESCHGVLDKAYIANAYGNRSKANYELGNLDEAVIYANQCIDLYYFETSCHVQKFMSLASSGKLSEAKKSFFVAERVLAHAIKRNESNLHQASSDVDRELYKSIDAVHAANLRQIQRYRSMLGNP